MGFLVLAEADHRTVIPLAPSTLLGRAWCCLGRFSSEGVPTYWLEVRWMGDIWAWRALAAQGRTRGSGAFLQEGWRALHVVAGRGARVHIADVAWIELVDAAPPAPFAIDLASGEALDEEVLAELVEVRQDAVLPLAAEGDPRQAFQDGATFVVPGTDRALRLHVPTRVVATADTRMDVSRGELAVEFDESDASAHLHQSETVVQVRGACVKVLAVYVDARQSGEGWLSATDAWAAWVDRGGSEDSPIERLGWERAKLRSQLARARVAHPEAMFETRRVGQVTQTRVREVVLWG